MNIEKLQTSIEKLKSRRRMTDKALNELLTLIKDIEKSLHEDLNTDMTKNLVKIKIDRKAKDNYLEGQYNWQLSDDEFALIIRNGSINFYDVYNDEEYIDGKERFNYIKDIRLSTLDENCYDVVRIDFKMLVIALEELLKKVVDKIDYIDNDALNFIDFCKKWYELK